MTTTEATFIAQTLREELADWFDGYQEDYDMEAICTEYAAALEARLEGLPGFSSLHWGADTEPALWVDAYAEPEQIDAIRDALEAARGPEGEGGVDLESIARRHDLTDAK